MARRSATASFAALMLFQMVNAIAQEQLAARTPDSDPELSRAEGSNRVAASASPMQEERVGLPVSSHIKGSEGILFPDVKSIVWDPNPPAARESVSPTETPAPIPTEKPYGRPGRCEENKTTRRELYPNLIEEKGPPFYDVLYAPEELVPLDSAQVYGTKAKVFGYGTGSDESVYLRMRIHQVPCVPYRYRMSNKTVYEDFGNNALKNYDKDPAGKGEFDVWVSRKLFGKRK